MPPELVKEILISTIRTCENTWSSHIVYTFNTLRNTCNFRRVVPDRSSVTKLLSQVYIAQDILPKPKNYFSMQRIMRNAWSFSGLAIDLKKIMNIERWNKVWVELCLLWYGSHLIKNVWWRTKKKRVLI